MHTRSLRRLLILLLLTGMGSLFSSFSYAQDPVPEYQPEWFQEEDYLYRAYFDFTGQAGGVNDNGQGLLFIPLAQDEESLFFADLRGNIFDDSSAEGNFGLAYRRMVNDQWIAGMYGFYDVRRSQYSNIFRQGSFGFELLSIEWDFRVNGYVPSQKQQRVDSLNTAYLSGNNIVMRAGEERAYWGTDFEVGRLLKSFPESNLDAELRGYVGGYYFDNSAPGFKEMTGPRARVEYRMFDLPWLGNGSRVVLAGQYQYDEVRGSQGTGLLTVRIPLPGNGDSQKLSRFQRRMVNPIVRDLDIVLNQVRGPEECAKLQLTGQELKDLTFIDADTVNAEAVFNAAGTDSVVLFDGSKGTINTSTGFVFNEGQLALAGGNSVNVVGCNSGAVASFSYGAQPTVNGSLTSIDVFTMADRSSIVGMNITGGENGIYGNNLSGFTINRNTISGAEEDGVHLDGDINGTITDNLFTGNGVTGYNDGLEVQNFTGGTISGNVSRNNGYGYYIENEISGGTISNNIAENNLNDGFYITKMSGGSITGNTSKNNGDDGFYFDDVMTGGVFSDNIASNNDEFGFNFDGVNDGTISGNQALDNAYAGFAFYDDINGGTISGNIAKRNDDGFYFDDDITGGTITGNIASNNRYDGFYFRDEISGGTFSNNSAVGNGDEGFDFDDFSGGTISNNIATGNGVNGIAFFGEVSGGTFSGNTATGNQDNGIKFGDTVSGGTISNNLASGNVDDGFDFEDITGGFITGNTATGNQDVGFDFDDIVSGGTISNNIATGNQGYGFDFIAPIQGGTISNNTASSNSKSGYFVNIFGGGNTASFTNNSAIDNALKGYDVRTGTPQSGVGTNTGSGNASDNNY
ncbi:right-handed parallel beta-helix repeat-containing protein [Gimesia maris]|uniref:right-handed parallel beta-helix repeat-containing protein n=1 Tax=Gimesia maris TaxID=122 RepID=UPI0030DD8BC9|tara:strand:- start:100305 stop:102878 length:2574 start_codon:yes stop_codon:yes gene_type:complete